MKQVRLGLVRCVAPVLEFKRLRGGKLGFIVVDGQVAGIFVLVIFRAAWRVIRE